MIHHMIAADSGSRRRGLFVALAALIIGISVLMNGTAGAQAAPAVPGAGTEPGASETPAVTLPEDLTREEVRALLSRISDAEARQLLLQQLDKVAAEDAVLEPAGMMDRFEDSLPALRKRLELMVSAVADLPSIGPFLIDKLTNDQPSRIWLILFYAVVVFTGGLVGEWLFRHLFTRNLVHPQGEKTSGFHKACILGLRLVVDLLGIAVFALCALALFFVFYQGHEPIRQAVSTFYWSIILVRGNAAVMRFLLAPSAPALRFIPMSDSAAVKLYRRIVWAAAAVIVPALFLNLLDDLNMSEGLALLVGRIVYLAVIGFLMWIVWHDRKTVAELIQSGADVTDEPSGPVKRLFASNWHILALSYLGGIYIFGTVQVMLTGVRATGPAIVSIAVLVAIPIVDMMMKAVLRAMLRAPKDEAEAAEGTAGVPPQVITQERAETLSSTDLAPDAGDSEYFHVLLKNLRIVLAILVVMTLAEVWDVDVRATAASGIGEVLANAVFDIAITLVLASAIWGIVKTAISRHLPEKGGDAEGEVAEGGDPGGTGGTRLETLLPLFQKFLFITLVVVVALIVLSELGVDIGPLIAGAGVVGIAIGFGAQTLVRDIVSGVFFLLEDAFRVGEYIDIGGGIRGMVEDISIRSFRLRHHNGPIHTVPFGGVNTLTNFSRDWVIMKLEMRLPFETDIEKVRKIVKKVGQKMMADPELGKNFLQPVKSQGVNRMDDSAFIFRIKFMAKPGEQFVLRREVYRRVQEALAAQGIHFAPKRVIVDASGVSPEQAANAAAAAEEDAPAGKAGSAP